MQIRATGFVGKIPSQPDFVRQHIGDRIGTELDAWILKSSQNMQLAKAELPGVARFVFSAAECERVAVGVIGKSQDQVGRSFPLVVYTSIDQSAAARDLAALPLVFGEFLASAEALVLQASSLSLEELRNAVLALPARMPAEEALPAAAQRCREILNATNASELVGNLFVDRLPDSYLYGLNTLRAATDAVRGGPAATAPTVLDCPINIDVDLLAWLDLTRRCLAWQRACPSVVWLEDEPPRLLISLGYASDQLLLFLAQRNATSARLWPLVTDHIEAISRARDALGPALSPTGQLAGSVDALWTLAARVAR